MEIPIYENLRDFKENYLIDYAEQTNTKFIKYLNQLHRNYKIIEHIFQINNSILFMINYSYNELNYKFKKYESTKLAIYENAINEIKSGINDNVKTLEKNIKDYHLNEFYNEAINIIKKYPSEYNYDELELIIKTLDEIRDNFTDIIEFIDEKIQDEKINLLRYSNNTNTNPTQEIYNHIPKNNFNEIYKKNRFTTPTNIAILKELGVFGAMAKKGFNRKSIIDTLYQITGANSKNLEKYYDSMVKNDNIEFNNTHTEKAKEFLNSKGF